MKWYQLSKQISVTLHHYMRENCLFVGNGDCKNGKDVVKCQCQWPLLYIYNKQNTINTFAVSAFPRIYGFVARIKT